MLLAAAALITLGDQPHQRFTRNNSCYLRRSARTLEGHREQSCHRDIGDNGVMTVLFWLNFGLGAALLNSRGATIIVDGWFDHSFKVFVALVTFAIIVSWFGLGLGVLIKNSPVAIVVVLLWPLIIENLIALAFALSGYESAWKWMPYQTAFQGIDGASGFDSALSRPWATCISPHS